MSCGTCYGPKIWRRMKGKRFPLLCFLFYVMVLSTESVNGQFNRARPRPSPTSTPGLEAYRIRWMEFLKNRASTAPTASPFRTRPFNYNQNNNRVTTGEDGHLHINGFECERTFALFPNRNNPRMYHMCARSRDNWYVYHYFCPHGTTFSDGTKKCTQDRPNNTAVRITNNFRHRPRVTTTPSRPRFTTTARPVTQPIRRVPISRLTTPFPVRWVPARPLPQTTTTTTTTSTTTTTEATALEVGVTEPGNWPWDDSASAEDENVKTVFVTNNSGTTVTSSAQTSDEAEAVTAAEAESSDELNMIPESVNGPSRLPSQQNEPKPTALRKGGVSVTAVGRRPRIINLWRSIFQ